MDNLLIEKWNELIETDKAPVVSNKEAMAQVLESEENWLITEGSAVADMAQYTPILVPAVRRIFPQLLANEIVGVQPMNMPTGYAYALRYTYGKSGAVDGTDRGQMNRDLSGATVLFNQIALVVDAAITTPTTLAVGDIIDDPAHTYQATVLYFENNVAGTGQKILLQCVNATQAAFFKAASQIEKVAAGPSYGTPSNITLALNNEAGFNLIFTNYINPVTTAVGEIMGSASGIPFPEMKMNLERINIEVKTRKLKAEYTLELAQDLKAVHGLDAEAELINILEYEITAELDRELATIIYNKATVVTPWAYKTGTGVVADGRWEAERFRTLYTRIIKEANQIALTTRRGTGNFMICSTNVVSALESLTNFMYSAVPGDVKATLGVARVGTLDGRFAVYLDTFAQTDFVLVGYKGPGQFDTGVIYCPYVPLLLQKVTDPNTFQPKLAFMTRDAIVGNLYGVQNYYRYVPVDFTGSALVPGYAFGTQ